VRLLVMIGLSLAGVSAWLRHLNLLPAAEFGGTVYTSSFTFTAAVNPGNHTAVTAVNTSVASTLIKAGDVVIPIPPATLEAGIAVQGCHTVVDGSFSLRTTNASAGAIDPASATWTFVVLRR
jgi:hypothetical protein